MDFLTYKLKHTLQMLKKDPWKFPKIKDETCRSIKQQVSVVQQFGVILLTYSMEQSRSWEANQ